MLHVSRNTNQCLVQLNGPTQKQVFKFKYLGVAFTSDERQSKELGIPIGKAIAIMKALRYSVVMLFEAMFWLKITHRRKKKKVQNLFIYFI